MSDPSPDSALPRSKRATRFSTTPGRACTGGVPEPTPGPGCGDPVVVSVGGVEVTPQAPTRPAYGEVVVLPAGESYRIEGADRAEVHAKTDRSPPAGPPETIPA